LVNFGKIRGKIESVKYDTIVAEAVGVR